MKKPPPLPYSSRDIMAAVHISQRQLTRWFAHGILGPSPRRGPGVRYSEGQMLRARAAAMLRLDVSSLDEIRGMLDRATRAELAAWAERGFVHPDPAFAYRPSTTLPSVRCDHVELAPGLTLVVREDCDPAVRARAQEIVSRFGPGPR